MSKRSREEEEEEGEVASPPKVPRLDKNDDECNIDGLAMAFVQWHADEAEVASLSRQIAILENQRKADEKRAPLIMAEYVKLRGVRGQSKKRATCLGALHEIRAREAQHASLTAEVAMLRTANHARCHAFCRILATPTATARFVNAIAAEHLDAEDWATRWAMAKLNGTRYILSGVGEEEYEIYAHMGERFVEKVNLLAPGLTVVDMVDALDAMLAEEMTQ